MVSLTKARIPEPESIITGSAQVQVPENKIAVINVNQGIADFEIDKDGLSGFEKALGIAGPIQRTKSEAIGTGHSLISANGNQNTSGHNYTIESGLIRLTSADGSQYQGGQLYVGSTLVYTIPFGAGSGVTIAVPPGTIVANNEYLCRYQNVTSWFIGGTTMTLRAYNTSPYIVDNEGFNLKLGEISETTMRITLPAGAIFRGGLYVAEIYPA